MRVCSALKAWRPSGSSGLGVLRGRAEGFVCADHRLTKIAMHLHKELHICSGARCRSHSTHRLMVIRLMRTHVIATLTYVGLLFSGQPLLAAVPADVSVEISHWWVSPGEKDSVDVLRRHMANRHIQLRERIFAGSGTHRYGDAVRQRVEAGKPPMAAQVIGYDIHHWARLGKLVNLDQIAAEQDWQGVVPEGIQHLSKYQGHWYAVPITAHSTNWLWVNHAQFMRLGLQQPDSWLDLLAMLDAAKADGLIALAIGREPWEHTLLFESVAAGAGGAEFYRRVFLELDKSALDANLLEEIFRRMSVLRNYLDPAFATRSWDQATDLVRSGKALLQVQGSWVNGEFNKYGLVPGQDYECFRFPDTQEMFLFNSDQYMLFNDNPSDQQTRLNFVSMLMDPELQRELNITTGAAPARVDINRTTFNRCGQQAITDMRGANMRRTLMGSIAMGNANPGEVKQAIYQVVHEHLLGRLSDKQAASRLEHVIATAKYQ